MTVGRHPIRISNCWAPKCRAPVIFLANRRRGGGIPVNPDSLSAEDRARIELTGNTYDVDFDDLRHQRHAYTCKDPEYRPPKREGKKCARA